jgi:hypothetical protein
MALPSFSHDDMALEAVSQCSVVSLPCEFVFPEKLVNSAPETLLPPALLTSGIREIVGLASGEVSRAVGNVQFSDTLGRYGANEPPSSPPK